MDTLFLEALEDVVKWYDKAPTGADKGIDVARECAISRLRRILKHLKPETFTAALDLTKEVLPTRYIEVTGYANY